MLAACAEDARTCHHADTGGRVPETKKSRIRVLCCALVEHIHCNHAQAQQGSRACMCMTDTVCKIHMIRRAYHLKSGSILQ